MGEGRRPSLEMTMQLGISILLPLLATVVAATPAHSGEKAAFDRSVRTIVNEVLKRLPEKEKPVLLILPFQDIGGVTTPVGSYVADKLNIALANKSVIVLERKSLETALGERRLQELGLLDESTVVKLGRSLGATLAVYGTAVETRQVIALNLKLVNIDKGYMLGGVALDIKKTKAINQLIKSFPQNQSKTTERSTKAVRYAETPYSIGLSLLGSYPGDSDQFGTGKGGQFTFLYSLSDYFDIEAGIGHFAFPIKQDLIPSGSLAVTAVLGGLRFNFIGDTTVSPYLSGGLGYLSISKQSSDDQGTSICPGEAYHCPDNLNDAVGGYGGIGLNVRLNRNRTVTFNIDGKYLSASSQTGLDIDPPPYNSRKVNLGMVLVSAGLMYRY